MNPAPLSPVEATQIFLEQLSALGVKTLYLSDEAQKALHPASPKELLDAQKKSLADCQLCKLCKGRTQVVFGQGNPSASLVFVGEGPGEDEDRQGVPFVGRAGQLLTKMIENGMGVKRSDVYICNVVKCRPPGNRNPESDEIAACEPFLHAQLAVIKPKAIIALGKFAAQTLLKTQAPISRLRGHWHEYQGVKLMPTFHPSYILHLPPEKQKQEKEKIWEDLQLVMKELGLKRPSSSET
ncbi:MAG: uracil-DNA glycosylase [Candidatus Omnitrophota bacterium]